MAFGVKGSMICELVGGIPFLVVWILIELLRGYLLSFGFLEFVFYVYFWG